MGSGNRIGDAMMGVEVPALLLWGNRDPFCPAEVGKRGREGGYWCIVPYRHTGVSHSSRMGLFPLAYEA